MIQSANDDKWWRGNKHTLWRRQSQAAAAVATVVVVEFTISWDAAVTMWRLITVCQCRLSTAISCRHCVTGGYTVYWPYHSNNTSYQLLATRYQPWLSAVIPPQPCRQHCSDVSLISSAAAVKLCSCVMRPLVSIPHDIQQHFLSILCDKLSLMRLALNTFPKSTISRCTPCVITARQQARQTDTQTDTRQWHKITKRLAKLQEKRLIVMCGLFAFQWSQCSTAVLTPL